MKNSTKFLTRNLFIVIAYMFLITFTVYHTKFILLLVFDIIALVLIARVITFYYEMRLWE